MCFLAAVVFACAASAGVAEGGKKYLVHGWEFKYILPSDILRNQDKFKDVPFDGMTFRVNATNSLGESMMYPIGEGRWEREPLLRQVPDMRKVLSLEHFRESFIHGLRAPHERIRWTDDDVWATVAANMQELGWFTRQTGLKGILCDIEDYHHAKQFVRMDGDPEWDELVKIVRKRGAEIFAPLFRENPDLKVMFLWIMNFEHGYMNSADPVALARNRDDLEPAFFDGIIDVMPDTARLINGDENCYFADYTHRSYHKSCLNNYLVCPKFFSPENREKYCRLSQASFGFYFDSLVHDFTNPYAIKPINGSRVEHFRRNLRDATELATEYVWLWGEKHTTIDWSGAYLEPRINGKGTWSENLPELYDAMKCCKDPDRGLARRYRQLKENGRLKDLNADPCCMGDGKDDVLPAPFMSWKPMKETEAVFSIDRTQGCGDSACLRIEGAKRGCIYLSFDGMPEGSSYIMIFDSKGPVEAEVNFNNSKTGRIRSQEHAMIVADGCSSNGWGHAQAVVTLPIGADCFTFEFHDRTRSGRLLLVDNVHVYPFDFTSADAAPQKAR